MSAWLRRNFAADLFVRVSFTLPPRGGDVYVQRSD